MNNKQKTFKDPRHGKIYSTFVDHDNPVEEFKAQKKNAIKKQIIGGTLIVTGLSAGTYGAWHGARSVDHKWDWGFLSGLGILAVSAGMCYYNQADVHQRAAEYLRCVHEIPDCK